MSQAPSLLTDHLLPLLNAAGPSRPHITLTWAQSLDAKIAGPGGRRVILSGAESMLMTHWMRTMHDSILIGINTLMLDDPRLQINLLPEELDLASPQPIILDPRLRFPTTSRILSEWTSSKGKSKKVRQPWIICGDDVEKQRREAVEHAGARVIAVALDDERIPPQDLPSLLSSLSLRSVMIEGGSAILSSFLHASPRPDETPLVDAAIVTVAPSFIGDGIGVVPDGQGNIMPALINVATEAMGKDAVMLCRVERKL